MKIKHASTMKGKQKAQTRQSFVFEAKLECLVLWNFKTNRWEHYIEQLLVEDGCCDPSGWGVERSLYAFNDKDEADPISGECVYDLCAGMLAPGPRLASGS